MAWLQSTPCPEQSILEWPSPRGGNPRVIPTPHQQRQRDSSHWADKELVHSHQVGSGVGPQGSRFRTWDGRQPVQWLYNGSIFWNARDKPSNLSFFTLYENNPQPPERQTEVLLPPSQHLHSVHDLLSYQPCGVSPKESPPQGTHPERI